MAWSRLRELGHSKGRTTHGDAKEIRDLASSVEATLATPHDPVALPVISYYSATKESRDSQSLELLQAGESLAHRDEICG